MKPKTPVDVPADETETPRSRKKIALVAVLALALVGGTVWFLFLRPSGPSEPVAGEILTLNSTQINLADGHYLKIGLALQLVEGAEAVDGSQALDATINLFSGRTVTEVSKAQERQALKKELTSQLEERYEGHVMGVYFTEYVTQ